MPKSIPIIDRNDRKPISSKKHGFFRKGNFFSIENRGKINKTILFEFSLLYLLQGKNFDVRGRKMSIYVTTTWNFGLTRTNVILFQGERELGVCILIIERDYRKYLESFF